MANGQGDGTGPFVTAALAIWNADPTIRSLCGRTSECAIAWGDFIFDRDPIPMLCLQDTGETDADIIGDKEVTSVLAAFAAGPTADTLCAELLDAAESALTTTALMAQGIDACLDPESLPF